jgi:hypothetical protein
MAVGVGELYLAKKPSSLGQYAEGLIEDMVGYLEELVGFESEKNQTQTNKTDKLAQETDVKSLSFFKTIQTFIKNNFPSKPSAKIKEKLNKVYEKYVANGLIFKKALEGFKDLAERAGSWLGDILKFLFVMALFDPKGKFLGSIINFLIKMVVMFVNILAKYIPILIKTIINLVVDVFPPLLKQIVNGIFDALWGMFDAWIKEFPKDSILGKIMTFVRDLFGPDSILRQFFIGLAELSPLIIAAIVAFGIIGKLMALYTMLTAAAAVVGWPILAVVAALVLLWIYADKVAKFLESIWEWFKEINIVGKILIGVLALIFYPITLIIIGVYALVKLFQSIKKIGFAKTVELIWKSIKKGIDFVWKWLKKIKDGFNNAVIKPILNFIEKVKSIGSFLFGGGAWKTVKGAASSAIDSIWNWIQTSVIPVWEKIKEFFMTKVDALLDFLGSFAAIGSGNFREVGSFEGKMKSSLSEKGYGYSEAEEAIDKAKTAIVEKTKKLDITMTGNEEMIDLLAKISDKIGYAETRKLVHEIVPVRTVRTNSETKNRK